jgi:putative transposase
MTISRTKSAKMGPMDAGFLAPLIADFEAALTELGHTSLTVKGYSDSARHFAAWACEVRRARTLTISARRPSTASPAMPAGARAPGDGAAYPESMPGGRAGSSSSSWSEGRSRQRRAPQRSPSLSKSRSTAGFCIEALSEALGRFGKPGIFNTDQGAQFTSDEFTKVLRDHRIEISMDGRGRCHDNIFVERLWWTVKHEWVYLRPAANGIEQKRSLGEFFDWYNLRRPHQALGWRTPDEAYLGQSTATARAA